MDGDYIGEYLSIHFPNKRLQLIFADGVIALEDAHGLMTARSHYTEVVVPLQPPFVDGRVPQVVKVNSSIPAFFTAVSIDLLIEPTERPA